MLNLTQTANDESNLKHCILGSDMEVSFTRLPLVDDIVLPFNN